MRSEDKSISFTSKTKTCLIFDKIAPIIPEDINQWKYLSIIIVVEVKMRLD